MLYAPIYFTKIPFTFVQNPKEKKIKTEDTYYRSFFYFHPQHIYTLTLCKAVCINAEEMEGKNEKKEKVQMQND